jgi:NADH-ubiquinone oxidoreductase chain 3
MSSAIFFFIFIPLLAIILLAVNLIFAPHNPYQEKDSAFECGFHSFLGQNRTQFSISFFIFALLFLLFDLEILLVYPYVVSAYTNSIYGLVVMLIFFLALTLGFAFELGKNALKIDSRQMLTFYNNYTSTMSHISGLSHFASFLPSLVLAVGKSTAEAREIEAKQKELETLTKELAENRAERKKVDAQNSADGDNDSPNEQASADELAE